MKKIPNLNQQKNKNNKINIENNLKYRKNCIILGIFSNTENVVFISNTENVVIISNTDKALPKKRYLFRVAKNGIYLFRIPGENSIYFEYQRNSRLDLYFHQLHKIIFFGYAFYYGFSTWSRICGIYF